MLAIVLTFRIRRDAFARDIRETFKSVTIDEKHTFSQCLLLHNMWIKNNRWGLLKSQLWNLVERNLLLSHNVLKVTIQRYWWFGETTANTAIHRHCIDDYSDSVNYRKEDIRMIIQDIAIHHKRGLKIRKFSFGSQNILQSQINREVDEKWNK